MVLFSNAGGMTRFCFQIQGMRRVFFCKPWGSEVFFFCKSYQSDAVFENHITLPKKLTNYIIYIWGQNDVNHGLGN